MTLEAYLVEKLNITEEEAKKICETFRNYKKEYGHGGHGERGDHREHDRKHGLQKHGRGSHGEHSHEEHSYSEHSHGEHSQKENFHKGHSHGEGFQEEGNALETNSSLQGSQDLSQIYCNGCEDKCPLSNPGCGKGRRLAESYSK